MAATISQLSCFSALNRSFHMQRRSLHSNSKVPLTLTSLFTSQLSSSSNITVLDALIGGNAYVYVYVYAASDFVYVWCFNISALGRKHQWCKLCWISQFGFVESISRCYDCVCGTQFQWCSISL